MRQSSRQSSAFKQLVLASLVVAPLAALGDSLSAEQANKYHVAFSHLMSQQNLPKWKLIHSAHEDPSAVRPLLAMAYSDYQQGGYFAALVEYNHGWGTSAPGSLEEGEASYYQAVNGLAFSSKDPQLFSDYLTVNSGDSAGKANSQADATQIWQYPAAFFWGRAALLLSRSIALHQIHSVTLQQAIQVCDQVLFKYKNSFPTELNGASKIFLLPFDANVPKQFIPTNDGMPKPENLSCSGS